jgi:ABC-type antimicrobial peptide transport system permease subunit
MRPVFGGIAVGLICASIAGRLVAAQLYGVTPNDPWTMCCVAILLLVVGLCACWLPARRAMRINPLSALRFE